MPINVNEDDKDDAQTQKSGEEQSFTRYKLTGTKNSGEKVGRVILEGTTADPARFIDLGGEGDLTDEEHKRLVAGGYRLRKVGEDSDDDNEGEAPVVETKEQQHLAQAATAGGPASTGTGTPKPGGSKSSGSKS